MTRSLPRLLCGRVGEYASRPSPLPRRNPTKVRSVLLIIVFVGCAAFASSNISRGDAAGRGAAGANGVSAVAGAIDTVTPNVPAGTKPPDPQARTGACACTQVIGFSQTEQWYRGGHAFESMVDDARWQLLWNQLAGIGLWADPGYAGWSNAPYSPCTNGSTNPDRVILTITRSPDLPPQPTAADYVPDIRAAIANMRAKYPAVRQIILQPVVGGPHHEVCHVDGRPVRASVNHPIIDDAISLVIGGDVVRGYSPEVSTCAEYKDDLGHLVGRGASELIARIGSYYAQFTDCVIPSAPAHAR